MKTYQRVLEMLQDKERGTLITILGAPLTHAELIGKKIIWQGNAGFSNDLALPSEVRTEIEQICAQAQKEFQRVSIELADGKLDLMMEAILSMPRLIILGCGHVGQAVGKLGGYLGLEMIVMDDRPDFANPHLFPAGTRVICNDFSAAIAEVDPSENDYVVIVTRGHSYDRICLERLAGRNLAYVGMIGSKRRVKGLFGELVKAGVEEEWLKKVHSPIGLSIGAETPEEIAVSIMAEVIEVRRKGGAR